MLFAFPPTQAPPRGLLTVREPGGESPLPSSILSTPVCSVGWRGGRGEEGGRGGVSRREGQLEKGGEGRGEGVEEQEGKGGGGEPQLPASPAACHRLPPGEPGASSPARFYFYPSACSDPPGWVSARWQRIRWQRTGEGVR